MNEHDGMDNDATACKGLQLLSACKFFDAPLWHAPGSSGSRDHLMVLALKAAIRAAAYAQPDVVDIIVY